MRNLISFIVKNVHWLLFLLLISISAYLIVNNNAYQRSKYLALEHEFVGYVYNVSNTVNSYIGLKDANEGLLQRVAELESRNNYLENYINEFNMRSMEFEVGDSLDHIMHNFICAQVVNNNITNAENLITLNKGSSDGVVQDMGVFSAKGIVGIVMKPSSHFSVVIPVLNSKLPISCKIKNSDYFGSLTWDGKDPRYVSLEELPRHAAFKIGDTVVTTGYSSVFPEGVRVGIVEDSKKQKNDNYNILKVRLFTDFSRLKEVLIVDSKFKAEQQSIEEETRKRIARVGGTFNGN